MRRRVKWLKPGKRRKFSVERRPGKGHGSMEGKGSSKLVLHTSESAPGSIDGVVNWILEKNIEYHLVVDTKAKKVVQLLPFNRSARSLGNGGINGGLGCNRSGRVAIQVCVVGYASDDPFASLPGWAVKLLQQLCWSWGIPVRVRNDGRSTSTWLKKNGIFGHKNAPNNDHHDPGRIVEGRLRRGWKKRKRRWDRQAYRGELSKASNTHWPDKDINKMLKLVSKDIKLRVHIVSGLRTIAEQAELYRRYLNGTGNLAAPPGKSNHNYGRAADAGVILKDGRYTSLGNYGPARAALRRRGGCLPVASEAWHVERGSVWRA